MANLATEVRARYSSLAIVAKSNPDEPGFTTEDVARMNAAVADVQADFQIYSGVEYDETQITHTNVGVEGVIAKLNVRVGKMDAAIAFGRHDKYVEALQALSLITGRNRITLLTDAPAEDPRIFTRDRLADARLDPPRDAQSDLPSRLQ